MLGTTILGPFAYLTFLIKLNIVVPGVTEFVFGLGTLVSALAFYNRPQLFYVLPFKAIKLLVNKEGAGVAIYSYQWDGEKSDVKDPLFRPPLRALIRLLGLQSSKGI